MVFIKKKVLLLFFNPFTPESDQLKFPLQPHQKYYTTQQGTTKKELFSLSLGQAAA